MKFSTTNKGKSSIKMMIAVAILAVMALVGYGSMSEDAAAQSGTTYYISPTGNDSHSGLSEAEPLATFNKAWELLYPGDTLILLDGTYYQTLNPNKRNGEPGKPITIKAKNDGKAIIDGQGQRVPVKIGETWPGPINSYFVIEGIIAQNSSRAVFWLEKAYNNVLRRVSGYNAYTDGNYQVFHLAWSDNNLLEDCIAAGTGRKMIMTYRGDNNIIRRCFADWHSWDGKEWHDDWPWGENINIYFGNNNIIENSIGYGSTPLSSIVLYAPGPFSLNGNKVLGSMAIRSGVNPNGNLRKWGPGPNPPYTEVEPATRPQPSTAAPDKVRDFDWPNQRAGFELSGEHEVRDNLFQDVFSWSNAGLGFAQGISTDAHSGNRIVRATMFDNGVDNPLGPYPGTYGGVNTDVLQKTLDKVPAEDSQIGNVFVDWPGYPDGERNVVSHDGTGALLSNRYIDGVLTTEPLWPWPMEERIQNELGISVATEVQSLVENYSQDTFIVNSGTSVQTVLPGGSAQFTLNVINFGTFNDMVDISVDPVNGVETSLSATSVTPPGSVTLSMTDPAPGSAIGTEHTVPLTLTGGSITRTISLTLKIGEAGSGAPDYSLEVPSVYLMEPGRSTEIKIDLSPLNGFSEPVDIEAFEASGDLSIAPLSTTVTLPANHTLTVQGPHDDTFSGRQWYTVPITTSGGGVIHTAQVEILVADDLSKVYLPMILRE